MQIPRALIVFCTCATLCQAQASKTDQTMFNEARAKYDAPFLRNLESFDCAIDFSWKQHFAESKRVGDEGTDEELEKFFQPIQNRVTVTRDDVTVSPSLSKDAIRKLPHGGTAELRLEYAIRMGLNFWLPSSRDTPLPAAGTPVHFERSSSGYILAWKLEAADIEMILGPDMRLQSSQVRAPGSDNYLTTFEPGPQGFLLTSVDIPETGIPEPGHRMVYSYTYQTVGGVELPDQVSVVRESHHEVWRYKLTGCTVKTSK